MQYTVNGYYLIMGYGILFQFLRSEGTNSQTEGTEANCERLNSRMSFHVYLSFARKHCKLLVSTCGASSRKDDAFSLRDSVALLEDREPSLSAASTATLNDRRIPRRYR